MKFLDGRNTQVEIEKYVRKSSSIRLAVAFWGDRAPAKMGLLNKTEQVEIVCNLKMGGTNPEVIEALIEAGIVVSQSDKLHGKVYLFDDTVILGSSNASANGLSFQDGEIAGWHEANLITADRVAYRDASRWFERLPKRPISHSDLKRAKEIWSRRRKVGFAWARPSRTALIDAIKSDPHEFEGQRAHICLYSEGMSAAGYRALREFRKQHAAELNRNWDAFEGWPELPDFSDLVCFCANTNGSFRFDGFWHMPEDRHEIRGKGTTLQLCWQIKQIGKYDRPGPITSWRHALGNLKAEMLAEKQLGACVDLDKFKRYLVLK